MPKPMRVKDQNLLTDRILQQLKAEKDKELNEMKSSSEMAHINHLMKEYKKLNEKHNVIHDDLLAHKKIIERSKHEWNHKALNEYIKFSTWSYAYKPNYDSELVYDYDKLRDHILFELSFKTLGSEFNAQELCDEIAKQFSNKTKLKSVA